MWLINKLLIPLAGNIHILIWMYHFNRYFITDEGNLLKTLKGLLYKTKLSVPNDAKWWIAPILILEQSGPSVSIILVQTLPIHALLLCWLAALFVGTVNCKSEITGDSFLLFEIERVW